MYNLREKFSMKKWKKKKNMKYDRVESENDNDLFQYVAV